MGHRDDRERLRQSSIDRRRAKPSTPRTPRSKATKSKNPIENTDGIGASASRSNDVGETVLQDLRDRANRAASLHLWTSAAFFAEKAATLSRTPEDVLVLVRVYRGSGDIGRALRVLRAQGLEKSSASGLLLTAQCLLARNKPDECLELLGDEDPSHATSAAADIRAALWVLRARVHDALDNPTKVEECCRQALAFDPHCVDAFLTLTEPGLISKKDATELAKDVSSSAAALEDANLQRHASHSCAHGEVQSGILPALYLTLGDPSAPLSALPKALQSSADVSSARAARRFAAFEYSSCAKLCRELIRDDPRTGNAVILLYLASLVELGERQELFVYAHKLVDNDPREAITWLAVGYYYFASGALDSARMYLQKASLLDSRLVEAWIAIGHAYAAKDDSDHAMTSFSTAARLHPGSHLPNLFIGMQHARQNSAGLASQLFWNAAESDPFDPAPKHELGVLAYRANDLEQAVDYFKASLALWQKSDNKQERVMGRRAQAEEASLVNLGHCYRRLNQFERAKICFEQALSLFPNCPSTFASLALTFHCAQRYDEAIAMYHRALRFIPEDLICNELLERALKDHIEFDCGSNIP